MGRHNKKSDSALRRSSVIALTGMIPGGLVAVAATSGAAPAIPFLATTAKSAPIPDAPAPVATPAAEAQPAAETPAPVAIPEPAAAAPAPIPVPLPDGPLGIPGINFAAYQNAERIEAERSPGCGISWMQVAGIGRVESSHANGGKADDKGNLLEPVIGLPLDGSLPGQAVIMDSDGGRLDGDAVYDRAVGPTQFIPTTWERYGADGNGDGVIDPQNLYDAAMATANYLCDGGTNMRDLTSATKAILRYNNSMAYVANVTAWSLAYSTGIGPTADALPRIH
ncbi:lytic transglycosylase domain-containing protein [Rhodococcus tukisamuensis]|uniref:Membrane-bound lytic murein transglycosylase B n=1 Tax=Rhodococcus tukisamuensis TaxID=168276 RepID=A0A1G7CPR5_9NOCA|nr:lytic murein transglycosylase [Rhodococcus tukisamuensis]SDE40465.1 Membrane-bound lytic murein transglycosylase B [Rhodococcus tukisamuensis]